MPTQEERITALEQATREALVHMRDTDMAVTAMVGVIRSQGGDIRDMLTNIKDMRLDITRIEVAFSRCTTR